MPGLPITLLPLLRRWKTEALNVEATPQEVFASREVKRAAYYSDEHTLIFHCDAIEAADHLARCGVKVDCIVTSPPFYGQRDYGVSGQIKNGTWRPVVNIGRR